MAVFLHESISDAALAGIVERDRRVEAWIAVGPRH
jgi:hypothetical protein